MQDFAAVSLAPLPYTFDELLAAEVVASLTLPGDFAFDDVLGRNSRMVSAGHPQRIVALHTACTDNDIVQRIVECMTEVQRAGNVGRRYYDRKYWAGTARIGLEITAVNPKLEPMFFC